MVNCFDHNDIQRKIIIDTDTGGDDAAALMLAALSPNIEILGVTVAAGNVSLDQAAKNALMTLEVTGCDAPVYEGADCTVTGQPRKVFSVFGKDGMGDKDLIHPSRRMEDGSAVDFILETVRKWPDQVEIMMLAPATNIALAIRKDPETMSRVRRIWSMGTAGFGMGNATPVAEYNVFYDAEAYKIVTDSEIPMTIVGFDTNVEETFVTPEDYRQLMKAGGRSAFLAQALSGLMEYNKKAIGKQVSTVPDAVAMACLVWSDYMEETVTCHASTITNDDETHGQVILYRQDIHYDSYIFFENYVHEVVKKTKAEVFKERFFRLLREDQEDLGI